jgi:hypothetical protein
VLMWTIYIMFYSGTLIKHCGPFIFRKYHIQISAWRLELGFSFMSHSIEKRRFCFKVLTSQNCRTLCYVMIHLFLSQKFVWPSCICYCWQEIRKMASSAVVFIQFCEIVDSCNLGGGWEHTDMITYACLPSCKGMRAKEYICTKAIKN